MAVVAHRDYTRRPPRPPIVTHAVLRAGVEAGVREALLDDAEHLDLLVGAEVHERVDLEVDLERAVGGQDVDEPPQRCVERRAARRRRQGEDREPRFLLRGERRSFQLRQDLGRIGSGFEHRRVRRDREQVLGEPVVNLARNTGTLLGDRPSELGAADRPPHADEQDAVGEHHDEVALRDVAGREQWREDVVERRREQQRRAEREPAVEILAVLAVAAREADHREQREQSADGVRPDQRGRHRRALVREVGQPEAERARRRPDDDERDRPRRPAR